MDALAYAIDRRPVRYILDLDICAFFDRVNQDWLCRFLGHRIADQWLITMWLKAGVMEEGRWELTERGTPQGSVILANIYLHYGLDLWQRMWRLRHAAGYMEMVRYADDVVFTFQYRSDAERFQEELRDRLDQFGLSMHPEKTHLLEFGRYAEGRFPVGAQTHRQADVSQAGRSGEGVCTLRFGLRLDGWGKCCVAGCNTMQYPPVIAIYASLPSN